MIKENIGEILRQLRKGKKLRQPDLASKLGIVKGTIVNWERGHTIPSIKALAHLAVFFDVEMGEFINISKAPPMTQEQFDQAMLEVSTKYKSDITIKNLKDKIDILERDLGKSPSLPVSSVKDSVPVASESRAGYAGNDEELKEIISALKKDPSTKSAVLKLLRAKQEMESAMDDIKKGQK